MSASSQTSTKSETAPIDVFFEVHPRLFLPARLRQRLPSAVPQCRFLREVLTVAIPGIAPASIEQTSLLQIIGRVRSVLEGDAASLRKITEIIACEPELVIEIIRLANSATYNPSGTLPASELRAAVLRIGLKPLREYLLAHALHQLTLALTAAEADHAQDGC